MPFNRRILGFDRRQVNAVITKLTSEREEAVGEIERLRTELERRRVMIEELQEEQRQLSHALVSAHRTAQEIREDAERRARDIVGDAHERGEAIVQQAQSVAREVEEELGALLKRRQEAEESYASFVAGIVKAFEAASAQRVSSMPMSENRK